MWETNPLVRGWAAVRPRWAAIWLIPALWDLVKWGVLGQVLRLSFSRWDFTLGFDVPAGARYSLPPLMPTVEQLGLGYSQPPPRTAPYLVIAAVLLILALDCTVRGGYINLVNGAIHGVAPSLRGFLRGIVRFAPRFALLSLCWMGWFSLTEWLVLRGTLPFMALSSLHLIALWLLLMAEFITVTDDVMPPVALAGGPLLTCANLGGVLGVLAASGLVSAGLTAVAGAAGLLYPWLLAPVWAFFGTWLAAGALAAYQTDISQRRDPTGATSWPCPSCRVSNHPLTSACVACGSPGEA